jgi:hypothetical protein
MAVLVVGEGIMKASTADKMIRFAIISPLLGIVFLILLIIFTSAKGMYNERIQCQNHDGTYISGRGIDAMCLNNNGTGR